MKAVQDLEWAGEASIYGCMQLHMARDRAHLQLGNRNEAQEAVAYLRAHPAEYGETWAQAVLESGDLDAAAPC